MLLPDDLIEVPGPQPVGERRISRRSFRGPRWDILIAEQVRHPAAPWQSTEQNASPDLSTMLLRYILDASKGEL
jgi:hypothetical protein